MTAEVPVARPDDRISLRKLEILCVVVEAGQFSRAAQRLGVAKSVVTAHLHQLEQYLGIQLFVQQGRGVQLSEEGAHVHTWAVETLARGRAMLREVQGGSDPDRGAAIVGSSMSIGSFMLPAVFTEFRRNRPMAELSLIVAEAAEVAEGVERGDLDFGVVVLNSPPDDSALHAEHIADDEIILVTAPDGEPATDAVPLSALDHIPVVSPPRGSARRRLLDGLLGGYGQSVPDAGLEVSHPEAAKRAVLERMGATLITRAAVENDLRTGRIREVKLTGARLTYPIYSLRRADKALSPLQSDLLAAIGDSLRSRSAHTIPREDKH